MAEQSQESRGESEDRDPALWRKFFIILTGKTNGAHQSVVDDFKSWGQTEVKSPEDADYCLVFCPVSSRVGVDVRDAIERLPAGKAAVLVVMHHTFNTEQVIPPSRRLVTDPRVRLTLDCLFHQDKLLRCQLNGNMMNDIKKFFRFSLPETRDGKDPDRGGERGSKHHQDKTPLPLEDGNKKRGNTENDHSWWSKFFPNKNKTSENDIPNPKAASCSNMETFPPADPSGSNAILLQKVEELHEEIEAMKRQNAEKIKALKSETDEEIAKRDQKIQELQTDLENVKKHVGFPVELHPHGGPVLTNSGGGPGSMYTQNTAPKREDGAMNSSSEETPQQDGLSRLQEETDNLSNSQKMPKRMKKSENDVAELKQEVDHPVKSKSNEVPAAPDVRGEPGSRDQQNTDSMEDQAGPGEIPQQKQTSVEDEEKSGEKEKEITPEKRDGQPVASAEPKSKGDSDPAECGGQPGSTD